MSGEVLQNVSDGTSTRHYHGDEPKWASPFRLSDGVSEAAIQIVSHLYIMSDCHRPRPPLAQYSAVNRDSSSRIHCSKPPFQVNLSHGLSVGYRLLRDTTDTRLGHCDASKLGTTGISM